MKYIQRPGVVLTKVCGTSLLVPNRAASEFCPYVIRLPFLPAGDWQALGNGKTVEMLYQGHSILKQISLEEAKAEVDKELASLCEKGFLIRVEDDEA